MFQSMAVRLEILQIPHFETFKETNPILEIQTKQSMAFFDKWNHEHVFDIPSGELTKNYGKSPFCMGTTTISMAIFNCYVSSPEGKHNNKAFATWSMLGALFVPCSQASLHDIHLAET